MPSYARILGVSGSPREGGNADIAVREALRLLGKATGAEIYGATMAGSARIFSREIGEVLYRPDEFGKISRLAEDILSR
ncbi:MAG: hypothetical protein IT210_03135 [Armatimonadetes bacterium]|nr:hypothetical protein [Armatimonadota bacterium]